MPAPALHVLGTDLQTALYAAGPAPVDLSSFGYKTIDEIWGVDRDGTKTRYGAMLVNPDKPTELLNLIRGTKTVAEWESDAEAYLVDCNYGAGRTHFGFTRIFNSFTLASGFAFADVFKLYEVVRAMGHSLGSPLAIALAALYRMQEFISYAGPKAGDQAYGSWVRSRTKGTLYENQADRVPKLALTIDDPLDRFDFWQVKGTILMDARLCVPPVVIAASTNPDPIKRAVEDMEIAHSCELSYKPLILALP